MPEEKILFICKANVGRSQMAEAFYNKYSGTNDATSAGTHVGDKEGLTIGENEKAKFVWEVMDEEGIDVKDYKRTQLTPELVEEADKVIVITEKENCPDYLLSSKKAEYWEIEDAKGADYDFHIRTRNDIKRRVQSMLHAQIA